MSRPEWTGRAMTVPTATIDIGFLVDRTFYYGPDSGWTHQRWLQLREPLYEPQVEHYENYILSSALDSSVEELVRYYRDVLRLIAQHRKLISPHHFWLRPIIFAHDLFDISFPWYDTQEESFRLLDALLTDEDGSIFHDRDECWEFQAFAEGDQLFLRQSDPDSIPKDCNPAPSKEDQVVVVTNRGHIARQIPLVRQRIRRVLGELELAIGADYWSPRPEARTHLVRVEAMTRH